MEENIDLLAEKNYILQETKTKYYELAFEMLKLQMELESTEKRISHLTDEIANLHINLK